MTIADDIEAAKRQILANSEKPIYPRVIVSPYIANVLSFVSTPEFAEANRKRREAIAELPDTLPTGSTVPCGWCNGSGVDVNYDEKKDQRCNDCDGIGSLDANMLRREEIRLAAEHLATKWIALKLKRKELAEELTECVRLGLELRKTVCCRSCDGTGYVYRAGSLPTVCETCAPIFAGGGR